MCHEQIAAAHITLARALLLQGNDAYLDEVEQYGGGKGAGGLTHAGKRCALTSLHGTLVALREGVVAPRPDALQPCGRVARAGPKKLLS